MPTTPPAGPAAVLSFSSWSRPRMDRMDRKSRWKSGVRRSAKGAISREFFLLSSSSSSRARGFARSARRRGGSKRERPCRTCYRWTSINQRAHQSVTSNGRRTTTATTTLAADLRPDLRLKVLQVLSFGAARGFARSARRRGGSKRERPCRTCYRWTSINQSNNSNNNTGSRPPTRSPLEGLASLVVRKRRSRFVPRKVVQPEGLLGPRGGEEARSASGHAGPVIVGHQ
jgi:hypothetical protein